MQTHFFEETQLAQGVEFDAYVDGAKKTFVVRDISVNTDELFAQVEAEDEEGNLEYFTDMPLLFLN